MKILVGVDAEELYVPAVSLLGRLDFQGAEYVLAHSEPPLGVQMAPYPSGFVYYDPPEVQEKVHAAALADLEEASRTLKSAGLAENVCLRDELGYPASGLLDIAEEEDADLIAIGSGHRGAMESFFLGSVGRALAIRSERSFLVGRNVVPSRSGVHAVFATDLSEYAERSLSRLLEMNPRGLTKLTVVTATGLALSEELRARMRQAGEELVHPWREKGVEASYRLVSGHSTDALRETMETTAADLLVVGARGHGLIDRVLIGSLALHEVVAETYPVMVLRVGEHR